MDTASLWGGEAKQVLSPANKNLARIRITLVWGGIYIWGSPKLFGIFSRFLCQVKVNILMGQQSKSV